MTTYNRKTGLNTYGINICQGRISSEFKFISMKKKQIINENYEDYDQVVKIVFNKMFNKIDSDIQIHKEKYVKYQAKQNKKKKKK